MNPPDSDETGINPQWPKQRHIYFLCEGCGLKSYYIERFKLYKDKLFCTRCRKSRQE